ncbi:hypothetical protein K470DRAFT_171347 [Piedraia hortae CBS 480.64]|uniref:Uncharacterized protein n=1 Tax=Piedraia hortae CBS 480.64 TaxID=1314780 RepID=A0A6A7BS15_9PEZI|nr:hypothetical protein K470DRAFT_171347 [Piedraia hortae CBS 480.64]
MAVKRWGCVCHVEVSLLPLGMSLISLRIWSMSNYWAFLISGNRLRYGVRAEPHTPDPRPQTPKPGTCNKVFMVLRTFFGG